MRIARRWTWIFAAGLAACAAAPPGPPRPVSSQPAPTVAGTRWLGEVADGIDPRAVPRLEFVREGRVSGYTGCNLFSGTWKMEGDEVRVGALASTKRLCLGPEGETEKRVLAALAQGNRGKRVGGRLVFTAPGGASFAFREAAAT